MSNIMATAAIIAVIYLIFQIMSPSEEKTKQNSSNKIKIERQTESIEDTYDSDKYAICYGQMTKAHKKRGFHQSNRSQSISIKETVCKSFAKGDISSYEGKEWQLYENPTHIRRIFYLINLDLISLR